MRISIKNDFAFLCMPKCASTSIEKTLMKYSDLLTRGGNTALKHTNYRKYARFIEPYLKQVNGKAPETVCIMREPIQWLHSWYRYRKRDALKGKEKSTENMSFNEFCNAYMKKEITIGQQFQFLKNKNDEVGVDIVFKYENLEALQKYFEEKIGHSIEFSKVNVSPEEKFEISPEIEKKLKDFFKKDYEVYDSLT